MGINDKEYLSDKKAFWSRRQYGLDVAPVLNAVVKHPRQDTVSRKSQIITDTQALITLDMYSARVQVSQMTMMHVVRACVMDIMRVIAG